MFNKKVIKTPCILYPLIHRFYRKFIKKYFLHIAHDPHAGLQHFTSGDFVI